MELTLKDKQKLTAVTARKYRSAKKSEKTKILFTFIEQTGYNRKYAIHILANEGKIQALQKGLKARISHKRIKNRIIPCVLRQSGPGGSGSSLGGFQPPMRETAGAVSRLKYWHYSKRASVQF